MQLLPLGLSGSGVGVKESKSFLTFWMYVFTVWWVSLGSQVLFPLEVRPLLGWTLFGPKWALSIIHLKYAFMSVSRFFLLGFPGLGTKFMFLFSSLYSFLVKLLFE